MSFLSPSDAIPKLGIDIAAIFALRDMRPTSGALDVRYFVQSAEEAGAEAIRIAVDSMSLKHQRADVDAVINAVTEVHFMMPLTREMIDFACMVRPYSVCFAAPFGKTDAVFSDTFLQLVSEAIAHLQQQSVHVVLALEPGTTQLQRLIDVGITTIELNTLETVRGDAANQDMLRAIVLDAKRLGLNVHLSHGIDYNNVDQLAALGDIAQVNVGHAIAARAMAVGWSTAVREMKAALVSASVTKRASSTRRSDAGVIV